MADAPVKTDSVEDNYDKIHRATWARRTTGLFAGGLLGGVYGTVVGLAASFLPYALSTLGVPGAEGAALPGLGTVASTTALFAGVAAVLAMPLGADVGANAGSIAAALAEKEKRAGLEKTKEAAGAPEKEAPPTRAGGKQSSLYVPYGALITVPLFAAFGAVIALSPLTASTIASLGLQAQSAAAVAASAATFGLFGALMPFKNSMFTNKMSNYFMDVFMEKRKPFTLVEEKAQTVQPEAARAEGLLNEPPARRFAKSEKSLFLKHILEGAERDSHAQDGMRR